MHTCINFILISWTVFFFSCLCGTVTVLVIFHLCSFFIRFVLPYYCVCLLILRLFLGRMGVALGIFVCPSVFLCVLVFISVVILGSGVQLSLVIPYLCDTMYVFIRLFVWFIFVVGVISGFAVGLWGVCFVSLQWVCGGLVYVFVSIWKSVTFWVLILSGPCFYGFCDKAVFGYVYFLICSCLSYQKM